MTAAITAALIAAVVDGAGIAGTLTYAAVRAGATLTPAAPQVMRCDSPPTYQPTSPDHGANYRQMATQGRVVGSHRADDTGEILPPTAYGVATPTARIHEMPTGGMDTRAVVAAADEARQQQIREQEALAPVPVHTSRFRPQVAESLLGMDADADTRPAYTPVGEWAQTGGAA